MTTKKYIGSDEHWIDSVNQHYDEKEFHDKQYQKEMDKHIEKQMRDDYFKQMRDDYFNQIKPLVDENICLSQETAKYLFEQIKDGFIPPHFTKTEHYHAIKYLEFINNNKHLNPQNNDN